MRAISVLNGSVRRRNRWRQTPDPSDSPHRSRLTLGNPNFSLPLSFSSTGSLVGGSLKSTLQSLDIVGFSKLFRSHILELDFSCRTSYTCAPSYCGLRMRKWYNISNEPPLMFYQQKPTPRKRPWYGISSSLSTRSCANAETCCASCGRVARCTKQEFPS